MGINATNDQVSHIRFTQSSRFYETRRSDTIRVNTSSYLFQPAALGAYVGQRVVLVDVGNHRGHFVIGLGKQRNPADHLGHPERRVHIQSAEIVVNCQELYEGKRQA